MTTQSTESAQLLAELRQLIAALDRRLPQLSRSGEPEIAREAAALRARAIWLMRQVLGEPSGSSPNDTPAPRSAQE